jgi:hypothetical protein
MARVFVDTNVLFPFSVMDLMLALTEDSVHEVLWSTGSVGRMGAGHRARTTPIRCLRRRDHGRDSSHKGTQETTISSRSHPATRTRIHRPRGGTSAAGMSAG